LAYVAGDRAGELSAAPAGADVTHPGVHFDLDQTGERPVGDRRLGIGRLGPRLQGELFGCHAGFTVIPRIAQASMPVPGPNRPQASNGQLSALRA